MFVMKTYLVAFLALSGGQFANDILKEYPHEFHHQCEKDLMAIQSDNEQYEFHCITTTPIVKSKSQPDWMSDEQAVKLGARGLYYGNAYPPGKYPRSSR